MYDVAPDLWRLYGVPWADLDGLAWRDFIPMVWRVDAERRAARERS